ncbi:exo-alpha-sialidase [Kribbella sp. NPDC000426]|uniref:golvesin C-terminal-like domain-containing protein n=1 Tax=Kribbella sp. NPDC000426 TaxID=3154255 RepID=UPI00332F5C4F
MPISRRTLNLGIAAGAAAAALPASANAVVPHGGGGGRGHHQPAAPVFGETTLWDNTVDPLASYFVYGLIATRNDTLIACCEGRHEVCDAGPHDLLIRRSTDGGQTWLPTQTVEASVNGESWANPTFVADGHTGEVFLFYNLCARLPENTSCSSDTGIVHYRSSTDNGATWGERHSLDGLFDSFPFNWEMHGPGPGHGIQLKSGRLLLSVSHRTIITGVPTADRNYGASTIYSDDHGRTWKAGGEVPLGTGLPTVGEARLLQRADGSIVMNSRPGSGNDWPRDFAISTDDGLSWSRAVMDFSVGLFNGCDMGFLRYTDDANRVLLSRPDSPMRWNMTVAVSYDEGKSFRYSRSISPIRGYYSDLARLSDGTIVLLYGCDGDIDSSPRRVAVARFNLEWLTQGRDSLATGPGLSTSSYPMNYPRLPAGAVGAYVDQAIHVDRADTYELWLRYYRSADGGLVTVTVDGDAPRVSALDLTSFRGEGYDMVLLDRRELTAGRHSIRFTLAGAGRGGGTAVALEQLTLVKAAATPDVREEITVDNGGLGFETVGTWASGRSILGYYGFNYLTHAKGTGANLARFRPAIPGTGQYEVLTSYTADPNRASNAPYVVHHAGGTTTVAVNQQVRGVPDPRTGEWVSLGTFTFNAGLDGYVELSDNANGYVIADAVRWRRLP